MHYNKDEVRGKIDQSVGKAKEVAGRNTGDLALEEEGADQQVAGNIEHGLGKGRRKLGEALSDLGKKLGR
jgi:uncharacterized protein YjbJ (UPF0337 family)